jgi:hypothetical protein
VYEIVYFCVCVITAITATTITIAITITTGDLQVHQQRFRGL